MLTSKGITS